MIRKNLRKLSWKVAHRLGYDITRINFLPHDFSPEDAETIKSVLPFTLTDSERLFELIQAIRYIYANKIPGDLVECGVYRGGSSMAMAKTILRLNDSLRGIYLYDTFEGFPKPTAIDVSELEGKALDTFAKKKKSEESSDWCYVSMDEVRQNMLSTGYDPLKINFVKGLVENTIPSNTPTQIALLRLDTDFYSSTKHELIHLYPRLVRGGVLIIDDYGYWLGARQAVEEYFAANRISLFLHRMDRSGARIGIKV